MIEGYIELYLIFNAQSTTEVTPVPGKEGRANERKNNDMDIIIVIHKETHWRKIQVWMPPIIIIRKNSSIESDHTYFRISKLYRHEMDPGTVSFQFPFFSDESWKKMGVFKGRAVHTQLYSQKQFCRRNDRNKVSILQSSAR